MRSSFILKLVNGSLYDPIVYLRLINEKRAIMFDCGRFFELSNAEMLLIDALFISHFHMDHFMGFDNLLRIILHREKPLDIYGPEGIIEKVTAKLSAYTWNLTKDYQLVINVYEIHEDFMIMASFPSAEGFTIGSKEKITKAGDEIYACPRFSIDAVILDHNIDCLAFALREKFHVNIRSDAVRDRGYIPGPWIARLKEAIMEGQDISISVQTESGITNIMSKELSREIAIISKGQKIAYLVDVRYSKDNIEKFLKIAQDSEILFIETFYLDDLEDEAYLKGHLTAGQAFEIARSLRVARIIPMHISPRFHKRADEMLEQHCLIKCN